MPAGVFTDYSLEAPGVKYKVISVSPGEQMGVSPAGALDPQDCWQTVAMGKLELCIGSFRNFWKC